VTIRDGTEPGGRGPLSFDLRDVLVALGDRAYDVRWRCADLRYTSKDERDIPILERLGRRGESVPGAELMAGIEELAQVVDGEFEGLEKNGLRWVLIRAVDSSWWEVWTDDASVMDGVRNRFKVVEDLAEPAGQ
jgi:hypothetical protein